MEHVTVGIVGGDSDASEIFFLGFKLFPADKVVIITSHEHQKAAERLALDLEKFKVPCQKRVLNELSFETIFGAISEIRMDNEGKSLVLNVETDYRTSCIALSAAFINGVQAIGLMDGKVIAYPIMKFSYYSALSDKKLRLLKIIAEKGRVDSMEELSKRTGMSLPLIIYHIRGSKEKPGLETLGLASTLREKGRLAVVLTTLGKLISQGHVEVSSLEKARGKKPRK